jgi:hypothetical protein
LILEVADLLLNPFLTKTYTEGSGEYKGISRVVINKFKIYYESQGNEVLFWGLNFLEKYEFFACLSYSPLYTH